MTSSVKINVITFRPIDPDILNSYTSNARAVSCLYDAGISNPLSEGLRQTVPLNTHLYLVIKRLFLALITSSLTVMPSKYCLRRALSLEFSFCK